MWIFCCGMRRSGSTLQYQITAHLVESAGRGNRVDWVKPGDFPALARQHANVEGWKVFKNHVCTKAMAEEFHRQNALGVYCYRDPRDVVASSLQKWSFSFDGLWQSGVLQQDLENYKKWTRLPGVLVSKYEEMIRDLPAEVSRIAQHLQVPLERDGAEQIAAEYSLTRQRERIELSTQGDNLRDGFGEDRFDRHSLLHTNHIRSGAVGGWGEVLSPPEVAVIEHQLGDWLQAHGYELSLGRIERNWLLLRRYAGRLARRH